MKQKEIDTLFAVERGLRKILKNNKKLIGKDYLIDAIKELSTILEGKKDSDPFAASGKRSSNVRAEGEK